MVDDLISRSALLEDFRNTITEQSGTFDWLNMINRQPAVRNADKTISARPEYPGENTAAVRSMGQIVEITIDLTNPCSKPWIETFEITCTGKRNIHCRAGDLKRKFFIPDMDAVKCRGLLNYTYRYRTEETDYREIVESGKTADAVKEIVKCLTKDLDYYQGRLAAAEKFYQDSLE